jgi:5-methyltetrahydrofolate--homocysteine methyltransferase
LLDWQSYSPVRPTFIGIKQLDNYSLSELRAYIDWTFFFHAWKISGKYPAIFNDPVKGNEARNLFNDAQKMLDRMISQQMVSAHAVFGFFEANSEGESVILKDTASSNTALHFLRNQEEKTDNLPNLSLADFIAPTNSNKQDYIGLFAVTAGVGLEKWVKYFTDQNDDYSAIMVKILSDRLAEAFAELLHHKVRTEYWGYTPNENLAIEDILHEKYVGIRPAPGYPACPEHSEKQTIFGLLQAEKAGINLTENYAMYPAASVCGYYFAHPQSQYFALGRISREQVLDYANRKNITPEKAEKLLAQNLNY